ncbi:hypothetical protein IQ250_11925 [Pseudanabaenaceae cyanobacterium LEGE 13415]|nr:hypothetical protein [Pseudanabaenaceae cyanobacterium LEGE 13415]
MPPQIVSTPTTISGIGQPYTYQVVATDPENQPIRYVLAKAPAGAVLHPQTGVLSWTPQTSQLGSQSFEIQAIDDEGEITTQTFTVQVQAGLVNRAPSITSQPGFVADPGKPYTYQIQANDPDAGDTLTYQLLSGPTGVQIDAQTGILSWETPRIGTYSIVVGAVDRQGLGSAQGFTLTVRENHAPVIESVAPSQATLGTTYRYDVTARDQDGDALRYMLDDASIAKGIRIDALGRIVWNSTTIGQHQVQLTVTDAEGAIAQENFTITVQADVEKPKVNLFATTDVANVGETVTFRATATDNVTVAGLTLLINGKAVVLDAQGFASVTLDQVGNVAAQASAIDQAGNTGTSATLNVQMVDPTANFDPVMNLDLSDLADGMMTAPTLIQGSVGGEGFARYELAIAPMDSDNFRVIASGTSEINNGTLGTFDPSLLQNDAYRLRLMVYGNNGSFTATEETVVVQGGLKLGNFRLSFTDLAIPLTGIPISLTRTYDTLTSNQSDDFGYGWRMEFRDTDLRTSLRKPTEEEALMGRYPAFDDRTKVFITLPGGKRETFSFKARQVTQIDGMPLGQFASYFYEPTFVSEKGSTSKLSIEFDSYIRPDANGRYIGQQGQPFNPADPLFGGVYVLTTKDGTQYRIDAKTGDLLTVKDTSGNTLTYTDDAITSSTGQRVTFERDARGRIVSVKDPMQEYIRYEYDANGDLISVTDQEQKNVTRFIYDATYDDPSIPGTDDGGRPRQAHYLREVIDPLNRTGARLNYDSVTGRLIKTTNAAGQTIETSYDPENSVQVVKDAAGNPTEYEYDVRGNVVRQTNALGYSTYLTYDDNNNVTQTRDANGLVAKYEYDSRGNLTSKTEEYCGCGSVTPGKTYYTYDSFGNMTNLVLPTGASIAMRYDSRGNLLEMRDGKGNVIQSYTYYDNGLVKTETDTSGTSTYFYDDFGNLTKSVDADGSSTMIEYDFNGNLKRMVEDNGTPNDTRDDEISTFTYDKLGREKLADYGDGIWVKYDYEGAGGDWTKLEAPTIGKIERKLTADGKLAGWVTADGGTPTFIYDSAGRLWKETDATGVVTTEYTYDAIGRVSSVKDTRTGAIATKQYDAGNRVVEEVDPLLGFVRYEYYGAREGGKLKSATRGQYIRNASGDLIVDSSVALQTTRYEYNGLQTTVIDPLGRRTTSIADEYSLPIETLFENRNGRNYSSRRSYLYANNLQEAKDYPTRTVDIGGNDRVYTYDSQGRLKTSTDLGDGIYSYTYGEDGLASISSPLSQRKDGTAQETISYEYDDLGNLKSVKYSDLLARSMTYRDSDNRLGTVTLANGESIVYDYNESGQMTTQTGTGVGATTMTYTAEGAIASVTDSTGTTTYTYDSLTKRLSRIDNSNGSSIAYTYDLAGRVQTQTEWGSRNSVGYTTKYTYDTFGNLKTVEDPTGGITTMTYDQGNRLRTRAMPNGVTTTWEYDDLDRIRSVTHTNQSGQVLASVTYERQGVGEPTKITREDGSYVTLQYDSALRVTKESHYLVGGLLQEEITYVYDAAGKRIGKITAAGTQTYNYDKGYQIDSVTGTNPEDYDYDENGRMELIQRDGQTLDLDHDVYDRLTSVKNLTSNTTTNYVYDGQGRRVTAANGSDVRTFLIAPVMGGGLDSTDMMLDASGNMISNYVYAGGSSPFMRIGADGKPVYYLSDGMGSVIGLADQAGRSAAKFAYDSFGEMRSSSGQLANSNGTGGDFRFQGQWLESATGIYHFRARDYDSKTGTFLSRDPVDPNEQQPEAMNPYQAMYNNPYVYSDPSGMITMSEISVSNVIMRALNGLKSYTAQQIKDQIKDGATEYVGGAVFRAITDLIPADIAEQKLHPYGKGKRPAYALEDLLVGAFCQFFGELGFTQNLWFGLAFKNDRPYKPGVQCSPDGEIASIPNPGGGIQGADYAFKATSPTSGARDGYIIGDIKLGVDDMYKKYITEKDKSGQLKAINTFAKKYQHIPVTAFITYEDGSSNAKQKLKKTSLRDGVAMFIKTLEWSGRKRGKL